MRRFGVLGYVVLVCAVVALAARLTYVRHRLVRLEAQAETQESRLTTLEEALAELAQRPPAPEPQASSAVAAAPEPPEPEEEAAVEEITVAAENDEPTEDDVRFYIAAGFEEYFPDVQLSEQNVADAANAVMQMRTHRQAMRTLKLTRENADAFRTHREALHQSWAEFERATGVSMTRFLATASLKGESNEDALDEEPDFEYLSDYQP